MILFGTKKTTTTQQQQNKKANIKILAIPWNLTRDLSHPSLECYLSATETTERDD